MPTWAHTHLHERAQERALAPLALADGEERRQRTLLAAHEERRAGPRQHSLVRAQQRRVYSCGWRDMVRLSLSRTSDIY